MMLTVLMSRGDHPAIERWYVQPDEAFQTCQNTSSQFWGAMACSQKCRLYEISEINQYLQCPKSKTSLKHEPRR
eukprot:5660964-Pleurochrysis_carterae.AAC.1